MVVGAKYSYRESENNRQKGSESTGCSHRGFAVSWGSRRALGLTSEKRQACHSRSSSHITCSAPVMQLYACQHVHVVSTWLLLPRAPALPLNPAPPQEDSMPRMSLPALSGPRSQRPPLAVPCPTHSFSGCPSNWRALVTCSGFAQ